MRFSRVQKKVIYILREVSQCRQHSLNVNGLQEHSEWRGVQVSR